MKAVDKVRALLDTACMKLRWAQLGGQAHLLSDSDWTKMYERREVLTQVLTLLLEENEG